MTGPQRREDPDLAASAVTPVTNPPGLSEVTYRVSDFTGFRQALLTPLPGEQKLSAWSPGVGDLGLQVLEWWAYLADILTFYNERIANNSYLRTAAGPQGPPDRNVAGLVRLLGYQARPGTTAHGMLAAIRGPGAPDEALVIPAGLQIVSTPSATAPAQTFETDSSARFPGPSDVLIGLPADPSLFHQAGPTPAEAGPSRSVLLAGKAAAGPGDSLVLVKQGWDGTSGGWALVTVRSVTAETSPDGSSGTRVVLDSDNWTSITGPRPQAGDYRLLRATATAPLWTISGSSAPPAAASAAQPPGQTAQVPLATLARGVAPGDSVLFTGVPGAPAQVLAQVVRYTEDLAEVRPSGLPELLGRTRPPALMPRTVLEVRATDASRLGAAASSPQAGGIVMRYGLRDVGTLIPTPAATLDRLGLAVTVPAGLTLPADAVVALQDATGTGLLVTASRRSAGTVQLNPLGSDSLTVDPPLRAPISLLADLVPVSGGVTVAAEVLGDGDGTVLGQAFTLQHSPLVFLPAHRPGDPPVSTLSVTVNGVAWSEVPAFYRQPPDATVYLVRTLTDGSIQVCFGDGINGARLPTGAGNVVASYRYQPAGQPPPPGRLSTVLQPQPNLAAMRNAVPLTPVLIRKRRPRRPATPHRASCCSARPRSPRPTARRSPPPSPVSPGSGPTGPGIRPSAARASPSVSMAAPPPPTRYWPSFRWSCLVFLLR